MDYVNGVDRNQLFMMNLEEQVPHDSWARVVDFFVDNILPMEELGFIDVLQTEKAAKTQCFQYFHVRVWNEVFLHVKA